jgi:hypothetical protein
MDRTLTIYDFLGDQYYSRVAFGYYYIHEENKDQLYLEIGCNGYGNGTSNGYSRGSLSGGKTVGYGIGYNPLAGAGYHAYNTNFNRGNNKGNGYGDVIRKNKKEYYG